MQQLPTITLSGIDCRVTEWDIDRMLAFQNVELGLLWSESNADSRYLNAETVARVLKHRPGRCSVHICGSAAKGAFLGTARGDDTVQHAALRAKGDTVREAAVLYARRVQLNGLWEPYDREKKLVELSRLAGILATSKRAPAPVVISQWRPGEPVYYASEPGLLSRMPNQAILVDGSGGRGVSPEEWSVPQLPDGCQVDVGFAGGLALENLYAELPRILRLAKPGFWIDMETSLRTPVGQGRATSWFDTQRALDTVSAFNTLIARARERASVRP